MCVFLLAAMVFPPPPSKTSCAALPFAFSRAGFDFQQLYAFLRQVPQRRAGGLSCRFPSSRCRDAVHLQITSLRCSLLRPRRRFFLRLRDAALLRAAPHGVRQQIAATTEMSPHTASRTPRAALRTSIPASHHHVLHNKINSFSSPSPITHPINTPARTNQTQPSHTPPHNAITLSPNDSSPPPPNPSTPP